jgi:trimeric autotransporter adhesin
MKNPCSRTKLTELIIASLVFTCFALSFKAQAVSPPPDGGYPNNNTAEGDSALLSLTTGTDNTAIGFDAVFSNTSGGGNTAIGSQALYNTTTGPYNTAIGFDALYSNTTGGGNTASGTKALLLNTTGSNNTATGGAALYNNTTGENNTASGYNALANNSSGGYNTAHGDNALFGNTIGVANMASGYGALYLNTTGIVNTATGYQALFNNTTGNNNIALGASAGNNLTVGSNNIDIGNAGVAGESAIIRIGTTGTQAKTFLAAVRGVIVTGGTAVVVNATGQLGVKASSARFKEGIKSMDRASEAILSLQPVTFRYKKTLDPSAQPQFGLVAEQVAKVDPDLVVSDEKGKPFSVRYEEVNAMLLNEFLKEHRKVEEQTRRQQDLQATIAQQQSTNAEQQKEIQNLTATLKEQAAQIQKVSDQLRTQVIAPRVVANN